MLFFLTTKANTHPIRRYLVSPWGRKLLFCIQPMTYESFFLKKETLPGIYIFADMELLADAQRESLATIWEKLKNHKETILFNHPTRTFRRYQLLKQLKEMEINRFDVYRLAEDLSPLTFPVFLRQENDHQGRQSELIRDRNKLKNEIRRLQDAGVRSDDILITEFTGSPDADGLFRKYSAFFVNGEIIPRHVFFSKHWHVKNPDIENEACLKEEFSYVQNNPHEKQLKTIFEIANVQYGRIDYGLCGGRLQVWEINTNPVIMTTGMMEHEERMNIHNAFCQKFEQALRRVCREYKGKNVNYSHERYVFFLELFRKLFWERQLEYEFRKCIKAVLARWAPGFYPWYKKLKKKA